MDEFSILIIKEIAGLIFKKPVKSRKFLTVTYVKEVLHYILCNLLKKKKKNCIKLLIEKKRKKL